MGLQLGPQFLLLWFLLVVSFYIFPQGNVLWSGFEKWLLCVVVPYIIQRNMLVKHLNTIPHSNCESFLMMTPDWTSAHLQIGIIGQKERNISLSNVAYFLFYLGFNQKGFCFPAPFIEGKRAQRSSAWYARSIHLDNRAFSTSECH